MRSCGQKAAWGERLEVAVKKSRRKRSPEEKELTRLRRQLRAQTNAAAVDALLWDYKQTQAALNLSIWSIRDLVERGLLRPVTLPSSARRRRPGDQRMRRRLFDPRDVRALVDSLKSATEVR
jgi:hypothetical protein